MQNDDVDVVFGKMYKILAVFIASRIDINLDLTAVCINRMHTSTHDQNSRNQLCRE